MMRLKFLVLLVCLVFNIPSALADVRQNLVAAVLKGETKRVDKILMSTPQLNLLSPEMISQGGVTVLHWAAESGIKKIVSLILNFDLEVTPQLLTAKTISGNTPLHYASIDGSSEIIKELLNFDPRMADQLIKVKNRQGKTSLHVAADAGNTKSISVLLEINSSNEFTEITDDEGNSALGAAVFVGRSQVVAAFVRKGVSLDEIIVEGKKTSAIEFLSNRENDVNLDRETIRDRIRLLQHILSGRIESQAEMDWGNL